MASHISFIRNELEHPNLRAILDPKYASLPPAEIEALMEGVFGPDAAERYEGGSKSIFDDIGGAILSPARDVGRFATKAAPVVANIVGGALKGARAGSVLGLPGRRKGRLFSLHIHGSESEGAA